MSESRFSQVGWYAFSVSDNKTVSDALGELGLTTDNVGNNLYTLANEPIQQGETLTNDSWTPISKGDDTTLIEKFKSYWLLLESVPEEPEVAEFGTDGVYLNAGSVIYPYLQASVDSSNNLTYNNYIGTLIKGAEYPGDTSKYFHLFEDGYCEVLLTDTTAEYSESDKNDYTDGDISNDLTITYRQSKLDTSKYRLEIAANSTLFQGSYLTTLTAKLPIDFTNNSGDGISKDVIYPNYNSSGLYFTINEDGSWGTPGTNFILYDGTYYHNSAGFPEGFTTFDQYIAKKGENLTLVDGGNYLAFTNSNNDSVISVTAQDDTLTDLLFELKAVDSNADDPGQDNVFIDGIYDFTQS